MREPTVASVMNPRVVTVRFDTPFKEVVGILSEEGISAVPVIGPAGGLIGVVSEADVLAKEEFHGGLDPRPHGRRRARWFRSLALSAAELMTAPVLTIGPDEPVALAARRLAEQNVRRLFVVDDAGELVGVVSRRDVLDVFLRADAEIRAEIEQHVLVGDLRTVTVGVTDGVATVDGALSRRSRTELVCRLVRAVPGVVGVRANLTYRIDDLAEAGLSP